MIVNKTGNVSERTCKMRDLFMKTICIIIASVCTLTYLSTLVPAAHASHQVTLLKSDNTINLDGLVEYYEDKSSKLTIKEIVRPKIGLAFQTIKKFPLNIGYSKSTYWLRFTVNSEQQNEDVAWVLDPSWRYYKDIEFYIPSKDGYILYKKQSALRDKLDQLRCFTLDLTRKDTFYLKVRSNRMLSLNPVLRRIDSYLKKNLNKSILFGLFAGVILAMIIYNFIIYIQLKDKSYLYYVLFESSSLIYLICKQWTPLLIDHIDFIALLFANISGIAYCHFVNLTLELKRNVPIFSKLLKAIAVCILVLVFASFLFLKVHQVSIAAGIINLIAFISGITASIILSFRGNILAKMFLCSWSIAMVFFGFYILENFGFVNNIGILYVNFAVSTEAVLMSLVLSYRITILNKEIIIAEQAAIGKSNFLASMSHEIRTPITAILGYSEILDQKDFPKNLKMYIHNLRISSNHLLCIINDILDMAKIDAGKILMEKRCFHLDELLQGIVDITSLKAIENNNEFVLFVDPTLPELLDGDPLRIKQIVLNLINNASKFTKNGTIYVKAYLHEEYASSNKTGTKNAFLVIKVSDNGVGIPKDQQAKIFESFEQADTSTTRAYGGTGLGLSISHRLSHLMGGDLSVESEENQGTSFYFKLPIRDSQPTMAQKLQLSFFEGTIALVVDDLEISRSVIVRYLDALNVMSYAVSSWDDAKPLLKSRLNRFSLVIVNLQILNTELFDFLNKLNCRESLSKVPIIVLQYNDHSNQIIVSSCESTNFRVHTKPISFFQFYNYILNGGHSNKVENQSKLLTYNFEGLEVLVVDDNEFNLQVLDVILTDTNINVTKAKSGNHALELISYHNFDIILMDIEMPTMNGYETVKKIRSRQEYSDIPIIALTANVLPDSREKCMKNGMDDYLSKPINTSELLGKIQLHIRR